jgi:hypothetical protein
MVKSATTARRARPRILARTIIAAAAFSLGAPIAAAPATWVVRPEWVSAHENFLAGPVLQGRGSATRDEAIAAAYVAAQFERVGLKKAPGMDSYTQAARIVRPRLDGTPALTVGGASLPSLKLLMGAADITGKYAVLRSVDAKQMPTADIVVVTDPAASLNAMMGAAYDAKVKLLILPESAASEGMLKNLGGKPRLRAYFEGAEPKPAPVLATLAPADIARLPAAGGTLSLAAPTALDAAETTNAVGYLPGTDPKAGNLLISAHLDHLGIVNGTVMPGANDDASGTTAVIELAHALAAGKPMTRGILFVCYGSEEMGGFGSRYFADHPPVPLNSIVANLELEMIGSQDPKLPKGHLMMTGYERSNFGEILERNGALIARDPYPEQNFFQRSDNYSLALKGIVAHTVSGWAVVPTYHQPTDTVANLDIAFMARAIQSLIAPLRAIANGSATPKWRPNGRPTED